MNINQPARQSLAQKLGNLSIRPMSTNSLIDSGYLLPPKARKLKAFPLLSTLILPYYLYTVKSSGIFFNGTNSPLF